MLRVCGIRELVHVQRDTIVAAASHELPRERSGMVGRRTSDPGGDASMNDLDQRDYNQLHEFRYAIRRFLHFSENAARAVGLDPQQHQLLLTIQACDPEDGVTVSRIAERLLLRHHTAVELINRAVAHGLVTRRRREEDQRFVLVNITDTGRKLIQELSAAHLMELRTAGPELVGLLVAILGSKESDAPAD